MAEVVEAGEGGPKQQRGALLLMMGDLSLGGLVGVGDLVMAVMVAVGDLAVGGDLEELLGDEGREVEVVLV